MKTCKFKIAGSDTVYTYEELMENYYKHNYSALDIVYSAAQPRQVKVLNKVEAIAKKLQDVKYRPDSSSFSGPDLKPEGSGITTQELIDNPVYFPAKLSKLNRDDFIKETVEDLKNEGFTEEQAQAVADQIVKNWDKIAEDSTLLHQYLSSYPKGINEVRTLMKGTAFENVVGKLYDLLESDDASVNLFKKRGGVLSGTPKAKIIKNLNLKCKLLGIDQELIGHIDNIIVDSLGDLHIVNYKITTSSANHVVKQEKYKYQLALLKQMLAAEGFNTNNMTLSIIPIRLIYNDDYTQVKDVVAFDKKEYTIYNNSYVFGKYDAIAQQLIPSDINTDSISVDALDNVDRICTTLWPESGIKSSGISATVQEWIKNKGIVKQYTDEPGYYFLIDFKDGSDPIKISDPTVPKHKNPQIIEVVTNNIKDLNNRAGSYASARNIVRNIKAAYSQGFTSFRTNPSYSDGSGAYLDRVLQPYMQKIKDDYIWKIKENDVLLSQNIILFENQITGTLDVVITSPYDLEQKRTFNGWNNILGEYVSDIRARNMGGMIPATYGNIEVTRAMLILNEVLPSIEGNFNLGKILAISPQSGGKGTLYTLGNFNNKYFSKIVSTINTNSKEVKLKNNFSNAKYSDEIQELTLLYRHILENGEVRDQDRVELEEWGINGLLDSEKSIEEKRALLKTLIVAMENNWGFKISPEVMLKNKNNNKFMLYYMAQQAYLKYSKILDEMDFNEQDLSTLELSALKRQAISSKNAKLVTELYRQAIDKVADRGQRYATPVGKFLTDYYQAIGYTNWQNSTIGNQAVQFKNLYETDIVTGKKTMNFKNPYSSSNNLTTAERTLLKKALFTFAKTRAQMFNFAFDFTSENDPNLLKFIEDPKNRWYFSVPLKKASKATMRQTGYRLKEKKKNIQRIFTNPKEYFTQIIEGSDTEEENKNRIQDVNDMTTHNPYAIFEELNEHGGNINRASIINSHDEGFFETNLETLLIDFGVKHILTQEMKDVLIKTKGILLTLDLMGEITHKNIPKIINYINNFVTVNVHNKSIMEETSQKVVGATRPLRRLVTGTWIAGNLIGAVRDTSEGVWQNLTRSLNKYQTNVTTKDVSWAYKEVILHSASNVRATNLLSALCIKYRLSNFDIARVQEGLTTGRAGIMNYDNWLYATMRRPDYLNRMTLFVAKLKHDGIWDALSIDEETKELKYNWRKDKRFEAFASGRTQDPKYKEQMGLYYSKIQQYNQDHPDNIIGFQDDLPEPYSLKEIEDIKNVSDSIYGAYDKSERAMWENQAIGVLFGQFTTWVNGVVANYFSKSFESGIRLEQAYNDAGNPLFFDKSGNQVIKVEDKYIYEETGQEVPPEQGPCVPQFKEIPIQVQGILYTFSDSMFKAFKSGYAKNGLVGAFETIKSEVWADPNERKNIIKFFSDLLILGLFTALFKIVLDPAYKDYKKSAEATNIIGNAITSITYKAVANSYDGFKGPFNVLEFFGEKLEPPIYTMPVKLLTDVGKVALGQKGIDRLLFENLPLLRSFREVHKMAQK